MVVVAKEEVPVTTELPVVVALVNVALVAVRSVMIAVTAFRRVAKKVEEVAFVRTEF